MITFDPEESVSACRFPIEIISRIIEKGWGREFVHFNNRDLNLCCKTLQYDKKGSLSSFHYHPLAKRELFMCQKGSFQLTFKDANGNNLQKVLLKGDIIFLNLGVPHQLECLEDGSEILEVSTFHSDDDVVRIAPGDSQKKNDEKWPKEKTKGYDINEQHESFL